eukprot:gene1516-4690_t
MGDPGGKPMLVQGNFKGFYEEMGQKYKTQYFDVRVLLGQ